MAYASPYTRPDYCPACGAGAELEAFDDHQKMCAVFIIRCKCSGIYREERLFGKTYPKDPHGAWLDSRLALIAMVEKARLKKEKVDLEREFGEGTLEDLEAWRKLYATK